MMGEPGAFQQAFAAALRAAPGMETGLAAQPGFAVYRNTVMKAWIDALQANYPSVARLAGAAWFHRAAAAYASAHPARDPCLLYYGAGFPDFLAAFEPAAALPILPAVARLDRMRTECHVAPDAPPLCPAILAALTPAQIGTCMLRVHPAAHWIWFDALPAFSIWSADDGSARLRMSGGQGEGALLSRPRDAVRWTRLDAAGVAFLDACAAGATLAEAGQAALARCPHTDLAALFATLLECGAFAAEAH